MPATIRVQVSFQRPSALPEDTVVNTWHFLGAIGSSLALDMADITPRLNNFYGAFDQYMPVELAPPVYTAYDLGEVQPRAPLKVPSTAVDPVGGATYFPNEVALCLSYYSQRNLPRQRGRLYLGPFIGAAGTATAQGDSKPADLVVGLIADAAKALVDAPGPEWAVQSVTDGVLRAITNMWIDNAWDTQRRRGTKASSRVTRAKA